MAIVSQTTDRADAETSARRLRRLAGGWGRTPTQLRAARALLVLLCVAAGSLGMYSARARADATAEIEQRAGPLSVDAIDVYRSLAAADAFVATEFLLAPDPEKGREKEAAGRAHDAELETAADRLAHAGSLAPEAGLTADRLASIASQLPEYAELVGRSRALGAIEGRSTLSRASDLMQSTILRRAEALQRGESRHVDDEYRRAGSLPRLALASCVLALAALAGTQIFLFRRTRRVFNTGLAMSSVLVVGALLWSAHALSISGDHLESSRRHSGSVTDALGLARIAAFQARSNELLALVVDDDDDSISDSNFAAKTQLLHREGGKGSGGGALGAAARLATDDASRARVGSAVEATDRWGPAHTRVEDLRKSKQRSAAVASTVGGEVTGSGVAFQDLDSILARAVGAEDAAFSDEIRQADGALDGLVVGTGALALAAAAAAVWGLGRRLEEYR